MQRQKLGLSSASVISEPQFSSLSLRDPEYATSRIAETVTLDLNDSRLLIDHFQSSALSRSVSERSDPKKAGRGAFTRGLSQRYNISNDEAYDLLKENHQSKVRSMLEHAWVEHSLPAMRLQWPFVSLQNFPRFPEPRLKLTFKV